jgi:hypothetical protein
VFAVCAYHESLSLVRVRSLSAYLSLCLSLSLSLSLCIASKQGSKHNPPKQTCHMSWQALTRRTFLPPTTLPPTTLPLCRMQSPPPHPSSPPFLHYTFPSRPAPTSSASLTSSLSLPTFPYLTPPPPLFLSLAIPCDYSAAPRGPASRHGGSAAGYGWAAAGYGGPAAEYAGGCTSNGISGSGR